ncbi:hypothetical protein [Pseudaquabacterium terrae]|uniref:hypothetical protein n=1 Tax=Pseudaquabacterium terrae TaxID=2732868 RepID=UPI003CCCA535
MHYLDVPDPTCLQRIAKRNGERPEGSYQLTEADFTYVSSFFEPPEEAEGFRLQVHAVA